MASAALTAPWPYQRIYKNSARHAELVLFEAITANYTENTKAMLNIYQHLI